MENPKSVNIFLVGCLVSVLAGAIALSLYALDCVNCFTALGIIALFLVGCAVVSLVVAIQFGPVVWLLSWLSNRKSKRKH